MERCLAQAEAHFIFRLQTIGGFGGKSDQLNAYNMLLGDPGLLRARPRTLSRRDERSASQRCRALAPPRQRVVLSVVPRGRLGLALEKSRTVAVS